MKQHGFNQDITSRFTRRSEHGRLWAGIFFIVIGGLFLARTAGVDFPVWFFTWPMILIAIGLYLGIRHGFSFGAPVILLLIGGIFLAERITDDLNLRPYLWPAVLITIGAFIIFRPRRPKRMVSQDANVVAAAVPYNEDVKDDWDTPVPDSSDVLDITTVFSGVKKKVLSKHFRGGDIVSIMGGTEIDLRQADFNQRVTIDNFTMFGGTKLIIPADWDVQSEVVAIFGGVDDKRPPATNYDPRKIIFLEGTCLFGGIEIKNF